MHREFPSDRATSRTGAKRRKGETRCIIQALRAQFEAFRSTHRPYTRVPTHLREAVAEAVASGADEDAVRRSCRLSKAQIERWTQQHPCSSTVRVFDVVDDEATVASEGGGGDQSLQLRLGPWCVSVHLWDASGGGC